MVALRSWTGSLGGGAVPAGCDILRSEHPGGEPAEAASTAPGVQERQTRRVVPGGATVQEVRVGAVNGDDAASGRAAGLLQAVGAHDALVLQRDPSGAWWHAAGAGAGAPGPRMSPLDVTGDAVETLLARALRTGSVVRVLSVTPTPVVAGYRAATAALVAVGADAAVVLGAPGRSEPLMAAADHTLRATARGLLTLLRPAAEPLRDASADRRGTSPVDGQVVDELRALHAVQELTGALRRPPAEAAERVARVLLEALGSQLAAVWLEDGPAAVVRQPPAPGSAAGATVVSAADDDAVLAAAVTAAAAAAAGPSPAPAPGAPLRPEDGAVACLVMPLSGPERPGGPAGGVLAVRSGPRAQPFSPLRRRIATQLVHTASTVLAVVLAREKIEQQLNDTRLQLGRDALTEVGSRHHWDSELAAAQGLVDAGVPVTVALLDLDDLKHVNDTYGHAAGDELLRTCGSALRACLRGSSDVVARVGGDEFAVLVPRVGDVDALAVRLRAGVEAARTAGGLPLRVSIGVARAEPGRTVTEAVTAADAAMYEDKRHRRALRAGAAEHPGA